MCEVFSSEEYKKELDALFVRFPSVQNTGFGEAYKPGLDRMREFCRLLGDPQTSFRSIHIAGTNGKGSVANMLASVLSASGLRTGLYTSPHIEDFRERMRIACGGECVMVPREYVLDFIRRWKNDFERLDLSFFEITTGMAFKWFADSGAGWAVIETGLGGRLDSTNVLTPELSIITSIGLDHCDLLGNTLAEIAGEKAGIIKPGVPVVLGEVLPETAPVFEEVASECGSAVTVAQEYVPSLWDRSEEILSGMDLQGPFRRQNLRTVLSALDVLDLGLDADAVSSAICRTASNMDFHGRWEKLCDDPETICDIGHNAAALRGGFARLEEVAASGRPVLIVYGIMADKDLGAILPIMPVKARYWFAAPRSRRSLPAEDLLARVCSFRRAEGIGCEGLCACPSVAEAVSAAMDKAHEIIGLKPLVYIGGSTFVVSEAVGLFANRDRL